MNFAWLPNLFLDQNYSDVKLRIHTSADDRETEVPAHRLVLQFSSKVFKVMLENDNFREGHTGNVELKVKGHLEDAIVFLRYLYTKELSQGDLGVYISVLHTAHLYEVEDLVKLCNERIAEVVSLLTVCKTFERLKNVGSESLLSHCKDVMLEFAFLIFRKDLHLLLDQETMSYLLASDNLNVLDEEQALGALWRWGCARQVLENKSSKMINERIEKYLSLLRPRLMKKVADHSPWFSAWNDFQSRAGDTVLSECDLSAESFSVVRRPARKIQINSYSHVARLSRTAESLIKIMANERNNCLLECLPDRDILLSGLTMQLQIDEQLTSQYKFQFCVNNVEISEFEIFETVLVNQYQTEKFDLSGHPSGRIVKNFYVYDLTFVFNTPVLLEKTQISCLTMDIISYSKPLTSILLTAHTFPKGSTFKFEGNLHFRAQNSAVAVSKIYYFM